eukprot:Nitzschia sp. Nitz4//scaffold109_size72162//33335//34168//NITZ4_005846-RA/size72162-processed-gene-0.42-mRNA-1//-1//CDS//3329532763//8739//frame0
MPRRSSRKDMDDDGVSYIRVIAPATLAEGYTFDVLVDDESFTVHVPKGGVKEGQEFEVPYYSNQYEDDGDNYDEVTEDPTKIQVNGTATMDSEDTNNQADAQTTFDSVTGAPNTRWRTSLCSCCDVVTQATFWMGMCFTPVLIAQLLTRLGLTWDGKPGTPEQTALSFNRILFGMIFALALWKIPLVGGFSLLGYYLWIVVGVGASVRGHMRRRYNIPPTLPNRCFNAGTHLDDRCCMLFCGCCSTIQMARHTHDDKEYPGHGCTTTGLGLDAPVSV